MRKKTVQIAVAAAAGLMLTGCGDTAYSLTGSEESIIVSYAAHMVTKYNTYQKEGLSWVDMDEAEEEELPAETEEQETEAAPDDEAPGVPTAPAGDTEQPAAQTADFAQLFGVDGVSFSYVGARLDDSYVENSYYAVQADRGYTYLILGIDITNNSEQEAALDFLSRQPRFSATVNGEVRSPAEVTILTQDFAAYEGTVAAGETVETVLLFQVPDSVVSVDSLNLEVSVDGNNYQIIL